MSKENARLFIKEIDKNPQLCALVNAEGADYVSIARDAGFELTQTELDEAVQEIRDERRNSVIESLSPEDLDKVAGGTDDMCPRNFFDIHEDAPDGHEIGCIIPWHHKDWCDENKIYCGGNYLCYVNSYECTVGGGTSG